MFQKGSSGGGRVGGHHHRRPQGGEVGEEGGDVLGARPAGTRGLPGHENARMAWNPDDPVKMGVLKSANWT